MNPLALVRYGTGLVFLLAASLGGLSSNAFARDSKPVVELWPQGAPGSEGKDGKDSKEAVRVTDAGEHIVSSVHRPSITVYTPTGKATGAGVLVMPGGGHRQLSIDHEGYEVARWFSEHGIAAFVLKYRLARQEGSTYSVEGHALADVQRALRTIRAHAKEWRVDPARLGVLGFSAGGEIAQLAAQRGVDGDAQAADLLDRESNRAAFQLLIYPGRSESIAPSAKSPPAFLLCGEDDRPDIAQGVPKAYLRFKEVGVSAELHVFSGVGHGFGVRASNRGPTANWLQLVGDWLDARGFLSPATPQPAKH